MPGLTCPPGTMARCSVPIPVYPSQTRDSPPAAAPARGSSCRKSPRLRWPGWGRAARCAGSRQQCSCKPMTKLPAPRRPAWAPARTLTCTDGPRLMCLSGRPGFSGPRVPRCESAVLPLPIYTSTTQEHLRLLVASSWDLGSYRPRPQLTLVTVGLPSPSCLLLPSSAGSGWSTPGQAHGVTEQQE